MHFNIFSLILLGFAAIALIAIPVYPDHKKESIVTAIVFAAIGIVVSLA